MTLVDLNGITLSEFFTHANSDRGKLYGYARGTPERMSFFNLALCLFLKENDLNPFYKARFELANQLLSEMNRMRFITPLMRLYVSVSSVEDLERLNIYFRQYVRYSRTPWRFDVDEVMSERFSDPDQKKIARSCRKLNLSEMYGYLCTWYFEGEERERLVGILTGKAL